MKKILIDSDVCLDSITGRYPFSVDADKILQLAEERVFEAYVTAESFSNIWYILRKLSTAAKAIDALKNLRLLVQVAGSDQEVVDNALQSGWKDFEDAIQYHGAVKQSCDAIVTRNTAHFKQGNISVYQPAEFLELIDG